jgi:hypothetical protein
MGRMSQDAPGPRPRQVTVGGWVVAIASALLVVTVFDAMTHLHSVDTRDALRDALSSGSAKGLGLSVDEAISVIRWALLVAGVAAATTAVLGVFVLQRHTAARVVLSVAAVPIALSAVIGGGGRSGSAAGVFLLGIVVAGATALLWTEPARDWFAGRVPQAEATPATPATPAARPTWPPAPSREVVPRTSESQEPAPPPRAVPGWGDVRPPVAVLRADPVVAPVGERHPVPVQVRIACILTWVFSALTASVYVGLMVAAAVDRAGTVDLVRDSSGISDVTATDAELIGVLLAMSALMLVWCILASVLAALTWRRQAWASGALLVSCGVATLFEVVGFPFSLLHIGASVAAFVLLLRPSARAWSRGPGQSTGARDWPAPSGSPVPPAAPDEPPPGKPPVW